MAKKNTNNFSFSIIMIFISFILMFMVNYPLGLAILLITIGFSFYSKLFIIDALNGNKAYLAKDYKTALLKYKKAASSKFVSSNVITGYMLIELKCGDPKTALDYIENILKTKKFKDNELLSLQVSKALALWKTNNPDAAIHLLENLIQEEKSSYIYETLTSLLLIKGRLSDATNLISDALEYDNESIILKSNYGELKYKLGEYNEAEKIFADLMDEDVKFIEPFYYSALIHRSNGEHTKAIDLLEKAVNTNDSLLTSVNKADAEKALDELKKLAV